MMNDRLQAIKEHVKRGLVIADIGCDHAFLPIALIQAKIADKVYACDIAKGPLYKAKENIIKAGLSNKIFPILSDGMVNVPSDTEGIIIAGMGGQTAIHIIANALAKAMLYKQIILQVNRGYEELRKYIFTQGFKVQEEWVTKDRGFYYLAFTMVYDGIGTYTEEDIFIGPCLKKKKDLLAKEWFQKEIDKAEKILPLTHDEQLKKRIRYYQNYVTNF